MQTSIQSFNQAVEKSNRWLKELSQDGSFANEEQAYSALRAVLHSLRDRLVPDEAVHLGAELPMLIRGVYYEGFNIKAPQKARTQEEFLNTVRAHLRNANNRIDAETATRCIFAYLDKKISQGEIKQVKHMLPANIQQLWS